MKKRFAALAVLLIALTLFFYDAVLVGAMDLPIDINAIGGQETREGQATTRIGANLFTADSRRANDALATQIYQRQSTAAYLFADVSEDYEVEPRIQLINAAQNAALFSQPTNFSNVAQPQATDQLSMWFIIPIIALSAVGGLVWALSSRSKKKEPKVGVY